MVKDKDTDKIVELLPKEAHYFICKPDIGRALDVETLATYLEKHNLKYDICDSVTKAVIKAKKTAKLDDYIYIGGSTFVVAEALQLLQHSKDLE